MSKTKKRQVCTDKPLEKNQCECELTAIETEILRNIFQNLLQLGRTPTIKEIGSSIRKSNKEVINILNELETKDLILRRKGTQEIVSIYPLSTIPTRHQLILDSGKKLFAMCAVDALGMPIMFNRDVKIVSRCEKCKQEINIEVKKEEIISKSHSQIMIWSPKHQEARQAETCCPKINFFCSKRHLQEWEAENPDLVKIGHSVQLEKAFSKIKECWKGYGEILGIR